MRHNFESLQYFESLQCTIQTTLIKDRHYLGKLLHKIKRLQTANKPIEPLMQQFEKVAKGSAQKAHLRQQQLPKNVEIVSTLPIAEKANTIGKLLTEHQVVVIAGETGSGKTTQLPKLCLQLGLSNFGMIAHTQPRRLAARSVAARIAQELQVPLGEQVGYQIRFTDFSKPETLVKLMTDGVLLADIQQDPYLTRYQCIIIDEAHERSLNIDFLLGYLKTLLPKRPDLKLIITSATIDLQRFSKHFNDAPILEISGRTFPVEVVYRPLDPVDAVDQEVASQQKTSAQDPIEGIIDCLKEIETMDHSQGSLGDVLVFLSGEREIRETAEALRKTPLKAIEVLPLYARLSAQDQNLLFKPHVGRRVVLSTNIAETSLTVPGIRYVIDAGKARISRYSYRSKVQRLPIEPISQASAKQRAGRCGRVQAGRCFRLYSEEDFRQRPEFTEPEIQRTNLAAVILRMLSLRMGDIESFPFVDAPDARFIKEGFRLLHELNAVDWKNRQSFAAKLTPLGVKLARLPIDPRLGRVIIAANELNCLTEILIIVSMLAVQDPREYPQDKQAVAREKQAQWQHDQSDFMGFLLLWSTLESERQALSGNQFKKYCQQHFIHYLRYREWRDTHRQLHLLCKEENFQENSEPADYQSIHKALMSGFLSNLGQRSDNYEYLGAQGKRFHIFPGSHQRKKKPKWCLVSELVETSRLFGRNVAKIEPEWVESMAKHLVKYQHFEPHWEQKRGQVVAFEQVSLYGLILIQKRRVGYEAIDPDVSRELFIRFGLVAGQIRTQGAFLHANEALKTSIEAMEDKTRRRDIVVDDEVLFGFYDQRVPKTVANTRSFEKWRKIEEKTHPNTLLLTKEILMNRGALAACEQQFPSNWFVAGARLPLSYRFEPGHEEDGVSLQVPSGFLNRLSAGALEWLVPGMIEAKCTALLKSLPKALRKSLVPIPDSVAVFLQQVPFGKGDLLEQWVDFVWKHKRVKLRRDDFALSQLEAHLRMNIQVLDDQQQLIAQGRDVHELKRELNTQETDQRSVQPLDSPWQRQDIVCWDFGDLQDVDVIQQGGVEFEVYPAIVNQGKTIDLALLDQKHQATAVTRLGVVALAHRAIRPQCQYWQAQLEQRLGKSSILYSGLGSKQALVEGLLEVSFLALWPEEEIRTQQAYELWLDTLKSETWPVLEKHLLLVEKVLEKRLLIQKTLKQKMSIHFALAFTDIKAQMGRLFAAGFPKGVQLTHLQNYPRYLEAILVRIDRLQGRIQQDRLQMTSVNALEVDYQAFCAKLTAPLYCYPELMDYAFWLEEYRVSLFAQQLGTAFSVSEKRIKQHWRELQSASRLC